MALIPALKKDKELIEEMKSAPDDGALRIWWLGQSGYLLTVNGIYLLIDPYLSDSLTIKYADTDKPHIRMSEQVCSPADLDFIDVVTSSHNHTDHLDAETLIPIFKNNPGVRFVIPEANRDFVVNRCGCDSNFPAGLNDRSMRSFGHISVHGIASAHESLDRNEKGEPVYMGYIFYIGTFCIYHSGDCIPYTGLAECLQRFKIDIALLPINGRAPERKVSGNFTIEEACELSKQIHAKLLIPGHYDMFEFNTADVSKLPPVAEGLGINFKIMQHGEMYVYNKFNT